MSFIRYFMDNRVTRESKKTVKKLEEEDSLILAVYERKKDKIQLRGWNEKRTLIEGKRVFN